MNACTPEAPRRALRQLFPVGDLCATPGALALMQSRNVQPFDLVVRHVLGDWGDLCEQDARANVAALVQGDRIMSSYQLGTDRVWVITEGDRSVTTFLLPGEY